MKTGYFYTFLLSLFFVATVAAQTNNDALFEKYAEKDGVTSVYISKKMFQLMPSMSNRCKYSRARMSRCRNRCGRISAD